jgi:uncharacterized protein YkwD
MNQVAFTARAIYRPEHVWSFPTSQIRTQNSSISPNVLASALLINNKFKIMRSIFVNPFFFGAFLVASWLTPNASAQSIDLQKVSSMIVEQTNQFRAKNDQPPVEVNPSLQEAAKTFARFMAEKDKYGHYADGRTPAERAKAAGYEYCVVRENIAYRTDSRELDAKFLADHFTQGWIDSPGHRENMLAEYVTETAVAIATTDGTTHYAVQLFGRPKSASYRVELSNESETTWTLEIESNGGSDEFEVPPRGVLKMTRCFPVTLSIVDTNASLKLKDSADVKIQSGDDGPTLTTN